jgi:signal transduction histidine kinase
MPDKALNRRAALDETLMNLTSDLVEMALGLYVEEHGREQLAVTRESWDRFEAYCQAVRTDAARCERCDQDHYERARTAHEPCLRVCHAGLVNLCMPIIQQNGLRATLIGGEFRMTDGELRQQADTNFAEFVAAFQLDEAEAARLNELRRGARQLSLAQYDSQTLPKIKRVAEIFREYLLALEAYDREAEALAHNFSTQLRSVLLYAHQLTRTVRTLPDAPPDLKSTAAEVLNAVTVLNDIVIGYLDHYEDQRVRFKPERIEPLIRRAADAYRAEAQARNVEIEFNFEPPDTPVTVECSRDHLLVALRNLVHNAIKYSYAGDPEQARRRYVSLTGQPREGGYEIVIENYGVGIEPDEYDLIFQRGYQGRHTRREYRSGAGRGLPLARHYITQIHRGTLRVASDRVGHAPDPGRPQPYLTRFTIWLPLKHTEEQSA